MSGTPGATASGSGSTCAASICSDPLWQEQEVPVLRSPLAQTLGTGVICLLGLQGRNWERRDGGLQRQHQRGSPGKRGHPETEIRGSSWSLELGPRPAGRSEPLTLQGLATRQSVQGRAVSGASWHLWGAGPLVVLGLPFLWHTNSPFTWQHLSSCDPSTFVSV